jgi:hypothetical protein
VEGRDGNCGVVGRFLSVEAVLVVTVFGVGKFSALEGSIYTW